MKKKIILIVALFVLFFLGWTTYKLMNSSNVSDSELIAFNIENIETIDRIKNEKFDQLNFLKLKNLEGSI